MGASTFVLMVLALAAAGQDTTCTTIGDLTNCHTAQPLPPGPQPNYDYLLRGWANESNANAQENRRLRLQEQQLKLEQDKLEAARRNQQDHSVSIAPYSMQSEPTASALSRAQLIQDIAKLVTAGRCDYAIRTLKKIGDLDLMQRTIEVCLATDPPS